MKGRIALGASERLELAAAPTFALMGLLTMALGGEHGTALCTQTGLWWQPINGMAPMYLLMAAFHLVPWFKLKARSRT